MAVALMGRKTMIRFLAAALLLLAGISPALASSTGGDVAAVSSSSPCLEATPSAGPSVSVALAAQSQTIDETGTGGYTAATTDACKTVKIGAASGTPTLTVPPAGTFPTNWGPAVYQNVGSVNATVTAQSGSFDGAGGASSFTMPANGWAALSPETSGNWDALVVSPTVTVSGPQLVQHPAGCANSGGSAQNTTISCAMAATGGGGHALIVVVSSCWAGTACGTTTGNASAYSVTAPSGCSAISGAANTGSVLTTGAFVCPNVASGVTSVTASSTGSPWYLSVKVTEWSGVPTSAVTEGGANNFSGTGVATTTCTTGSLTAGDVAYAAVWGTTPMTVSSPFSLIDAGAGAQADADDSTASGAVTAAFTQASSGDYGEVCFGIK